MRPRFDSRPLVLRRKYTATMRHTVVVEMHTQLKHILHLFFVIAASVIANNVANQEVLVAIGPQALWYLYIGKALLGGLSVATLGWFSRGFAPRSLVRSIHVASTIAIAIAFVLPQRDTTFAVVKYIAMDVSFAALLLAFGIMMNVSLGPREARQAAARVGAGGIVGGLVAGGVLGFGAPLLGSSPLYIVAAAFALAPIFFLPRPTVAPVRRSTMRIKLGKEHSEVPALRPYGMWVAITALVMVTATTMIDYQFRSFGRYNYDDDALTSFFGHIFSAAGIATLLFQFGLLSRLLDKLGVFFTAVIMPAALILCSGLFALNPVVLTLGLLKVIDSGANMSLQQATGNLLLAPLSPGARAVWQGRIDGLAKRGGMIVAGLLLYFFPWSAPRLVPIILVLCALWIAAVMVTRTKYVRLLTEMLGSTSTDGPQVEAYDGATLRLLETELAQASTDRAGVVLDLLEKAGHCAPEHLLFRIAERDPDGPGALMVVDHLAKLERIRELLELVRSDHVELAAVALLAIADIQPRVGQDRAQQILDSGQPPERLAALAAAILAEARPRALKVCHRLVRSSNRETRLAAVQGLSRASAGANPEIGALLSRLAEDPETDIARLALEALSLHPTEETASTALRGVRRREVRGAAMRALAEMGPPVVERIRDELVERLDEPHTASALAWALGRIGAESCISPLTTALDSPIAQVRLDAAVALSTLHRRRPDIVIPVDRIAEHYLTEIRFYARMRESSLSTEATSPAAKLLLRTLKQRGQISLEALFRMLSLRYPPDAMLGAFQAVSSSDRRRRQVALELLDNTVDPELSKAIADALGGVRVQRRARRVTGDAVRQLASDPDPFLASLARAVLIDAAGDKRAEIEAVRRQGASMASTSIQQILELQSLSLFGQSSAEDLSELASLISARRVGKGTVLFREGESADAMYIVRSGEIALSRAGRITDQVGAGEACGIIACLDQLPRVMTATATMDSSLLVLNAEALLQLLADRPLLMHSVFRALTASIRAQVDRGELGKKAQQDWSW